MSTRSRDPARIRAIARKVRDVDDTTDRHAKVLVFARNKQGKTRFAASGGKGTLIVDTNEHGTLSARGSGARVVEVESFADIADVYWWMASGKHKYHTVAIDGLPGFHRMSMDMVTDEAERRSPDRPTKQAERRDWGRAGSLMGGMLLAYRNLPMHVVFTCTVREIYDKDTEELKDVTLDLPAGVRGVALGAVDVIGYLRQQEIKVRRNGRIRKEWTDTMQVGPSDVFPTGDRTNSLGKVVIRPTMPKIIAAINGATEED